jgi:hypothetical protein
LVRGASGTHSARLLPISAACVQPPLVWPGTCTPSLPDAGGNA